MDQMKMMKRQMIKNKIIRIYKQKKRHKKINNKVKKKRKGKNYQKN